MYIYIYRYIYIYTFIYTYTYTYIYIHSWARYIDELKRQLHQAQDNVTICYIYIYIYIYTTTSSLIGVPRDATNRVLARDWWR